MRSPLCFQLLSKLTTRKLVQTILLMRKMKLPFILTTTTLVLLLLACGCKGQDDEEITNTTDCFDYALRSVGDLCFSGEATVQVKDIMKEDTTRIVAMKDLQVGDQVLVDKNNDKYETVYSFGHYESTQTAEYLQIFTTNAGHENGKQKPLEISATHLIFRHNGRPMRADQLQVGDQLLSGSTITKISTISRKGAYMPLTPSGRILVEGQAASNYVSLLDYAPTISNNPFLRLGMSEHFLMHAWMAPYRMVCFGLRQQHSSSSYWCEQLQDEEQPHSSDGILKWLLTGKTTIETMEALPILAQTSMLFLGLLASIERIFGPTMAPLFLITVLLGWLFAWLFRVSILFVSTFDD